MATQRRFFIAGNWKMYKTRPETESFLTELANALETNEKSPVDMALCASFTLLDTLKTKSQALQLPVQVAAQTMESEPEGAFTGEVSARMLTDLNVDAVVLGHSERRQYYNETDYALNKKVKTAIKANLTPILCVGETLEQREAGITDSTVQQQLKIALEGLEAEAMQKLVIAYEPVWAIGTGKVCEPDEANRVCALIRKQLAELAGEQVTADSIRILYGGSMKPSNAEGLLSQSDIDGGLIGGASLEADSFAELLKTAGRLSSTLVSSKA